MFVLWKFSGRVLYSSTPTGCTYGLDLVSRFIVGWQFFLDDEITFPTSVVWRAEWFVRASTNRHSAVNGFKLRNRSSSKRVPLEMKSIWLFNRKQIRPLVGQQNGIKCQKVKVFQSRSNVKKKFHSFCWRRKKLTTTKQVFVEWNSK